MVELINTKLQYVSHFHVSVTQQHDNSNWGFLVTNYYDAGRKVSKSNLDQGRKQKRPLRQPAVDAWRG